MAKNMNLQVLGGDYVKTALITEWKVKIGDRVKKGDVMLVCETAKITVDIEAPCDGVVEQILFPAGEDVDISDTIAVIGDGSGIKAGETAAPSQAPAQGAAPAAALPAAARGRVFVTPLAKKVAKEKGVDIEAMKAALGLDKITEKDVLSYVESAVAEAALAPVSAAAPAAAATLDVVVPVKGRRRAIGQKMFGSASSIPRVTHMIDVDMDAFLNMKSILNKKYPEKGITVTGLLATIVKCALKSFPEFNATYAGDKIIRHAAINLGIAVDMAEGLLVPVIKGCESMKGAELCEALNAVVKGCKDSTLMPDAYMGGTFTISNLGSEGLRFFTPIINAPEVAILGVGGTHRELAMVDGQVTEKKVAGLSLTFDHRAVDGAPAARFLKTIKELIENPFLLAF